MLLCHDPSQGYMTFQCPDCGKQKIIHYSCNSRLCPSCGRRLTEEWADKTVRQMLDCAHRHCVFTLADELWPILRDNRSFIPLLSNQILTVVKNVFKHQLKGIEITPGIISVLHTFGEDMKFNVHFHCMVTCGGVNNEGDWTDMDFFFYEGLRKVWQYHVLTAIKAALPKTWENNRLIDKLFKDHPNGFYVYAKDRVIGGRELLAYIARYVRHPAIAQSRIVSFDGKTVVFSCEKDDRKGKRLVEMTVQDFLRALVQHIPPKGFQLIKHLGIYANRSRQKYASIISMFLKVKKIAQKKLFMHAPRCIICEAVMQKVSITAPTDPPPHLLLSSYEGQVLLRLSD